MRGVTRILLAVMAGASSVLAFAPVDWFALAFVSLALLVGLLERAPSRRSGFCLGLAWGLGAFCAGISWLTIALTRYGNVFPPVAALIVFLFCAYLSLYPALACMLYVRWRRGGWIRRAVLFAALWVLAEWLRGTVFTGFPWLSMGYSQTGPLAGYFPIVGVYGAGGILAFVAALCAAVCQRRVGFAAWIGVILLGSFALSRFAWVEPDGPPLSVSLIQTNIDQSVKWDPAHFSETLQINAELMGKSSGELIVLPEAALPMIVDDLPKDYFDDAFIEPDRARETTILLGTFIQRNKQYLNAAVTLGKEGGQHYAKNHLVPFGEYSPPLFGWFYRLASIPMAQQSPGGEAQPPLSIQGRKIAVNICYEDVFGEELIARLPQTGLMLNLSNLAWYGDSFAQPQHLQIARVRAMETGRPMLRATNTGMTALVLPDGSVPAVQPAFTRGVLEVNVSAYKGLTPYARWGNVPALVAALAGMAAALAWGMSRH